MNIKIYVACHKPSFVPDNKFLYPIQVGCKVNNTHIESMLHDDDGDNISEKNPMYCELTAQYWAWKNDDADYYGLFHYRRYMSFADEKYDTDLFEDVIFKNLDKDTINKINLSEDIMQKKIEQYDVIATSLTDLKRLNPILKSIYHQYSIADVQRQEDMDVLLEIIQEKYPEYYETAQRYIHSDKGYFCNMFIMKKEIFMDYSKWLFDILAEHEKRRDYSDYNTQEYRVSGYLGERLFGIYYTYLKEHGCKCTELQRTLFESTEEKNVIKPYFKENNIAIAFAANDYFAPYLATTIQSLVDNTSKDYNYDIIIMSQDFSDKNKKMYCDAFQRENISIRYINPLTYMRVDNLFVRGHFSAETYYRLALFKMLPDYEKIVYLDADLIIQDDIAKLYNINLENNLLAATYDADTAGLYNGFEPNKKSYMDNILKIKKPYDYFQAGVLVFNLDEFRNTFELNKIMEFANSYQWELLDQDILNNLCQGRIKYVDMAWNVMVDYAGIRINQIISKAPYRLSKMYNDARKSPKIIHYAGPEKPWFNPEMDMGNQYWIYAKKTPYYEYIIYRMIHNISCGYANNVSVVKLLKDHFIGDIRRWRDNIVGRIEHQKQLQYIRKQKR